MLCAGLWRLLLFLWVMINFIGFFWAVMPFMVFFWVMTPLLYVCGY